MVVASFPSHPHFYLPLAFTAALLLSYIIVNTQTKVKMAEAWERGYHLTLQSHDANTVPIGHHCIYHL